MTSLGKYFLMGFGAPSVTRRGRRKRGPRWAALTAVPVLLGAAVCGSPPSYAFQALPISGTDMVYSPISDRLIVAAKPSTSVGSNQLLMIDPASGSVSRRIALSGQPSLLALSDDARTLYAAIEGGRALQRVDLSGLTVSAPSAVGSDATYGPYHVVSMALQPGHSDTLAVCQSTDLGGASRSQVAILKGGVQDPRMVSSAAPIEKVDFSEDGAEVYAYAAGNYLRIQVSEGGATLVSSSPAPLYGRSRQQGDRIYLGSRVFSASTGHLLGAFSSAAVPDLCFPDPARNRVVGLGNGGVVVFDPDTFLPLGRARSTSPVVSADTRVLITKGGVAALLDYQGSLCLQDLANLDLTAPDDPRTVFGPIVCGNGIRVLPLLANDLAYSPLTSRIYATLPGTIPGDGNSIVPLDPVTGAVDGRLYVGPNPGRLRASQDGRYLYVGVDGAASITRLDLSEGRVDLTFYLDWDLSKGLPIPVVSDIEVMPGFPRTIAVARRIPGYTPSAAEVQVYDDGAARLNRVPYGQASSIIAFGSTPDELYGDTTESCSHPMSVTRAGVFLPPTPGRYWTTDGQLLYWGGYLVGASGTVFDPGRQVVTTTLESLVTTDYGPRGPSRMVVSPRGHVAMVRGPDDSSALPSSAALALYVVPSGKAIRRLSVPGLVGPVNALTGWGETGLAFCTGSGQLFLLDGPATRHKEPSGDLNGDRRTSLADLLAALSIALGRRQATPEELDAGDYDGEGTITLGDVTKLLRAVLGLAVYPEE